MGAAWSQDTSREGPKLKNLLQFYTFHTHFKDRLGALVVGQSSQAYIYISPAPPAPAEMMYPTSVQTLPSTRLEQG